MNHGDVPDTGIPAAIAAEMTMAERYEWHQRELRRHRVTRRRFLAGSAAAAAVAAVGVSPFGQRAYAQDAPLSVANRRVGYGADASSQLRLAAQLSRNPSATKVFVDHGPTPALGATTQAEVRNLVTQIPASDGGVLAAEQFYAHVPVDALSGGTPALLPVAHGRRLHHRRPVGGDGHATWPRWLGPVPVHHDRRSRHRRDSGPSARPETRRLRRLVLQAGR